MAKEIFIGDRRIAEDAPLFVIAEIGVTCNYDMALSKELIDAAAEAGADAVKFIFWFPEEFMSDRTIEYEYETVDGITRENMFDMLDQLRFTLDEWRELKDYAERRSIILFSTVNSPGGIAFAEELGLEAYKLSSWDFNYLPLWRRVAKLGKPMLIDCGPVNTLDVAKVFGVMKDADNNQTVLLHCFHTENPSEMNMRSIPYMREAFDTLIGFSAADITDDIDVVGIALGSVVVEKRLTMSRQLPGHHHVLAKEPQEFSDYVRRMREMQRALGVPDLRPSKADLAERRLWFRHLVVTCDLSAGTVLTEDMLEAKRPEEGISPEYLEFFIGRTLKRDIKQDEGIRWEDV